MESMTQDQQHSALFIQLVLSLGQSGMMAMGKIPNPFTGKVEISLPEAEQNIELLAALKQRTLGNLNKQEQAILEQTLTNLRLTFASEATKPKSAANPKPESKPEPQSEPAAEGASD